MNVIPSAKNLDDLWFYMNIRVFKIKVQNQIIFCITTLNNLVCKNLNLENYICGNAGVNSYGIINIVYKILEYLILS